MEVGGRHLTTHPHHHLTPPPACCETIGNILHTLGFLFLPERFQTWFIFSLSLSLSHLPVDCDSRGSILTTIYRNIAPVTHLYMLNFSRYKFYYKYNKGKQWKNESFLKDKFTVLLTDRSEHITFFFLYFSGTLPSCFNQQKVFIISKMSNPLF